MSLSRPRSPGSEEYRAQRKAMKFSLLVGCGMLVLKIGAYSITGSAAILSDAAESVVHVLAVAFAAYSLRLSFHPADDNHLYGHERIGFFSAGVEGGLIVAAALFIFYEAVERLIHPHPLPRLGLGTTMVAVAGIINWFLGTYLIRVGKRENSLILVADGKHVLTDTWTSFGVVGGLILVWGTGWKIFDPILAMLVASNILRSGWELMQEATAGLMDQVDPQADGAIRKVLERAQAEGLCAFHELRHRSTGRTHWIEVHLLFEGGISLLEAHHIATAIEERLRSCLDGDVIVTTHLEPEEDHR